MISIREYLSSFRKRRAVRSYIKRLPRLLAKDYGFSRFYTPIQIKKAIERSGLNVQYSCYAIATFSERSEFNQFHHEIGENCDYDVMRAHIGDWHFNGDANFTISDAFSTIFEGSGHASHGESHDAGGGHGHSGH